MSSYIFFIEIYIIYLYIALKYRYVIVFTTHLYNNIVFIYLNRYIIVYTYGKNMCDTHFIIIYCLHLYGKNMWV